MSRNIKNSVDCSNFLTLHEFYKAAKNVTSKETWDYIIGGSETETTLKRNRLSLDSYAFKPRVLRDVENIDTTKSIFNKKLNLPVFFAPIGSMQDFVKDGAIPSTISAAENKIFHMLSSTWSGGTEAVGNANDYPKLFQLYIRGDQHWVYEQISRAIDNGFIALCLTVDLDAYGRRERDLAKRYKTTSRKSTIDPSHQMKFSWKDVEKIKKKFKIPIIIKGIATVEDSMLAIENEIDVIYISNHGGRQLDYGIGGCDLIAKISNAVNGKAKIFFDGGILRGTDIIKAIALGADLVGLGRLQCYAAAAGGVIGLNRMLEILKDEIEICMRLLGVNSLNDLSEAYVTKDITVNSPSLTSSFPLLDEGY